VIDEGWFFENPQDRETPAKLHYAIDKYGRYVPVPARFPSAGKGKPSTAELPPGAKLPATIEETGFEKLGKFVHAQGLKFGIHIVRGIPRASVERDLPVQGSSFRATDVADTADACPWDPTNWGVKDNAAGQAWYDSLLKQYAAWGVDLLKVDCIGDHPYKVSEIRMIRKAIEKTGRPIVLSISPGPMNLSHADEIATLANMWRISDDEWDIWKSDGHFPQGIFDQFPRLAAWAKYAQPGTWPDADMLALGELRPSPGWGKPRTSRLTPDEQKTLLTAWAMARRKPHAAGRRHAQAAHQPRPHRHRPDGGQKLPDRPPAEGQARYRHLARPPARGPGRARLLQPQRPPLHLQPERRRPHPPTPRPRRLGAARTRHEKQPGTGTATPRLRPLSAALTLPTPLGVSG
jgi:hypothetical protein